MIHLELHKRILELITSNGPEDETLSPQSPPKHSTPRRNTNDLRRVSGIGTVGTYASMFDHLPQTPAAFNTQDTMKQCRVTIVPPAGHINSNDMTPTGLKSFHLDAKATTSATAPASPTPAARTASASAAPTRSESLFAAPQQTATHDAQSSRHSHSHSRSHHHNCHHHYSHSHRRHHHLRNHYSSSHSRN